MDSLVTSLIYHSFPTRRSSDLGRRGEPERWGEPSTHREPIRVHQCGRPTRSPSGPGPRPGPSVGFHVDHGGGGRTRDRKSTRLNSSHANISYAVFCLKKKKNIS